MLYRSYLHALLLPVFLGISLFGVSSLSAATQPLAPLPPAVIQTLVKMHQQPGSALPELLQQHLQETSDLIDEAQAEDQLLQAGKANLLSSKQQLLESKRVEIAGFRVQVEDELAQTRAKLAKLQLSEQLDSFDNYTAQVGQRFDSLNSALANFTLAQANWPRRRPSAPPKSNCDRPTKPVRSHLAHASSFTNHPPKLPGVSPRRLKPVNIRHAISAPCRSRPIRRNLLPCWTL